MSQGQRTASSEASEWARHPTSRTTREEFLDGIQDVEYHVGFGLSQTQQAAGQVDIHELVEFAEDLRWVIEHEYNFPVLYWNAGAHKVSISLDGVPLGTVADRDFESDVESLAEEHDIGLRKTTSLSRSRRGEGSILVKYNYGLGERETDYWTSNPDNPQARVDWVGGYRGQPETLEESTLRITNVESKTIHYPRLYRLKKRLASLL